MIVKRFALAFCALLLSVTASAAQYIPGLNQLGIAGIFPPGTPMREVVEFIKTNVRSRVASA